MHPRMAERPFYEAFLMRGGITPTTVLSKTHMAVSGS